LWMMPWTAKYSPLNCRRGLILGSFVGPSSQPCGGNILLLAGRIGEATWWTHPRGKVPAMANETHASPNRAVCPRPHGHCHSDLTPVNAWDALAATSAR
jgi:hypothetical protein